MEYTRRQYRIEGPQLAQQPILVTVTAGNAVLARIYAKPKGMAAVIMKDGEPGVTIEAVEPGFRVAADSEGFLTVPVAPWQREALDE